MMATQNPIESEGTYPLPEAQVDRFMLKVVVDYPEHDEELTIVQRALDAGAASCARCSRSMSCARCRRRRAASTSTRRSSATRSRSPPRRATRRRPGGARTATSRTARARAARSTSSHAARALALLRGRRYALAEDVRELAKDVLRHRIVLSYEALAEDVDADTILDRVLAAVPVPEVDLARGRA